MSVEEFDLRSSYKTPAIKRKKKRANVKHFERHLAQLKSGCSWISDDEVTHFAYRGVHGSTFEVIVLNGREYELAGNMVAGGKTEISFPRAAVDESIGDRTIDYEKLADRFIVKQASERMNSAVNRITDPETD